MLCGPDAAPQWLRRWRWRKPECIGQRIVHPDDGARLASARSWPCRHDFHAERLGRVDRLRQPEKAHFLHLWRTFSRELLHEDVIARQRHMPRLALHDREPVETARLLPRRATMRMETRRNHDQRGLARTKRAHGLRENLAGPEDCGRPSEDRPDRHRHREMRPRPAPRAPPHLRGPWPPHPCSCAHGRAHPWPGVRSNRQANTRSGRFRHLRRSIRAQWPSVRAVRRMPSRMTPVDTVAREITSGRSDCGVRTSGRGAARSTPAKPSTYRMMSSSEMPSVSTGSSCRISRAPAMRADGVMATSTSSGLPEYPVEPAISHVEPM